MIQNHSLCELAMGTMDGALVSLESWINSLFERIFYLFFEKCCHGQNCNQTQIKNAVSLDVRPAPESVPEPPTKLHTQSRFETGFRRSRIKG